MDKVKGDTIAAIEALLAAAVPIAIYFVLSTSYTHSVFGYYSFIAAICSFTSLMYVGKVQHYVGAVLRRSGGPAIGRYEFSRSIVTSAILCSFVGAILLYSTITIIPFALFEDLGEASKFAVTISASLVAAGTALDFASTSIFRASNRALQLLQIEGAIRYPMLGILWINPSSAVTDDWAIQLVGLITFATGACKFGFCLRKTDVVSKDVSKRSRNLVENEVVQAHTIGATIHAASSIAYAYGDRMITGLFFDAKAVANVAFYAIIAGGVQIFAGNIALRRMAYHRIGEYRDTTPWKDFLNLLPGFLLVMAPILSVAFFAYLMAAPDKQTDGKDTLQAFDVILFISLAPLIVTALTHYFLVAFNRPMIIGYANSIGALVALMVMFGFGASAQAEGVLFSRSVYGLVVLSISCIVIYRMDRSLQSGR